MVLNFVRGNCNRCGSYIACRAGSNRIFSSRLRLVSTAFVVVWILEYCLDMPGQPIGWEREIKRTSTEVSTAPDRTQGLWMISSLM